MDLQKLYTQLKTDEGLRLHPYRCSAGHLTIGYGHNMDERPLPCIIDDDGITEREAQVILEVDTEIAIRDCLALVPALYTLPEPAQQVLANMSFNLGGRKLRRFTRLLLAVNAGDFNRAADEMVNSDWYHQVGNRAKRLVAMMRSAANPVEA